MNWHTAAPPPEWKPGMLLLVETEGYERDRGAFRKLTVEVLGSCTLVHPGWNKPEGDVPGTEVDGEGLGIDRWEWRGLDGAASRFSPTIRGWHPGLSEQLDELPEVEVS